MTLVPLIADIARGSTVDGPGLRTVVFIKGCPMRCVWCHNPECMHAHGELMIEPSACGRCGRCVSACSRGAIALGPEGVVVDRARCNHCGDCVKACDRLALQLVGRAWDHDALLELLARDVPYYAVSGGGVTFSGGEASQYLRWLAPLVEQLHARGIHVALETCGLFDLAEFDHLLAPWLDLVLFDLKLIDPVEHERLTGVDNHRILANLRALIERGWPRVEVRVPLVPGMTATPDNLMAIADLLRGMGVRACTLLPYNPSGSAKWAKLGRTLPQGVPLLPIPLAQEQALRAAFDDRLSGSA